MRQTRLIPVALAAALPLVLAGCSSLTSSSTTGARYSAAPAQPSMTSKVTSSIKDGTAKLTGWVTPKPSPPHESDPIALANKPAQPGSDLYLSMAQLHERSGHNEEAERLYQKALKADPDGLPTMVAYAHFQDRLGKLDSATKWYHKAIAKHPEEASLHNDLGLCYQRRGLFKEAQQAMHQAVVLSPDRKLYRNNVASVLVQLGQYDDAFAHLSAVHSPAVAHYNVGYLLARKGQPQLALAHFRQASEQDPSLVAAQQWIVKLSPLVAPQAGPSFAPAAELPQPALVAQRIQAPPTPPLPPAPRTVPIDDPPVMSVAPTVRPAAPAPDASAPPAAKPSAPQRVAPPREPVTAAPERQAPAPAVVQFPQRRQPRETSPAPIPPSPEDIR